jgi:hypothetical protein
MNLLVLNGYNLVSHLMERDGIPTFEKWSSEMYFGLRVKI